MAIDLRQLRYVVTVAEERQMTRAARRLHIAQPALSQAIGQLELSLGVQLFRRHPGGVEPTQAGEALLPRAREALSAAAAAEQVVRAAGRSAAARLAVSFVAPLAGAVSSALADTVRSHPEVELSVSQLDVISLTRDLREERSDLGFLWFAEEEPELTITPILRDPRMVFLGVVHHLADRPQLVFDEVVDEPLPSHSASLPGALADRWELAERRRRSPRRVAQRPGTVDELAGVLALGDAICLGCASFGMGVVRPGVVGVPLVDAEPVLLAAVHRRCDLRPALRDMISDAARRGRATTDHCRTKAEE